MTEIRAEEERKRSVFFLRTLPALTFAGITMMGARLHTAAIQGHPTVFLSVAGFGLAGTLGYYFAPLLAERPDTRSGIVFGFLILIPAYFSSILVVLVCLAIGHAVARQNWIEVEIIFLFACAFGFFFLSLVLSPAYAFALAARVSLRRVVLPLIILSACSLGHAAYSVHERSQTQVERPATPRGVPR